jgi:WD40 repeat protein
VVWDVLTSSAVAVAARHAGGVYGVAVSWDGRTLATTGEDNRLALWDVRRRAPQSDLPVDRTRTQHRGVSGLWGAAFARDGTLIAFDSTDTLLWRAEQIPGDAGSGITDLGFEGSGTLRTLDESGVLTTWRTDPELHRTDRRRLADGPLAGRFGPGGTRLVLGAAGQPVTVHDVHSGQAVPLSVPGWPAPEASTRIAAFAGDGRSVLAVTTSQPIVVWNTDRPTSTRHVATRAESDQITGVGFVTRDASRLAVAWIDGSITVTDPGSGTDRLLGHREPAQALAPTPDGSILATAGADPEVILWNTSDWSEIGRLSGHTAAVWQAEVSPDGKLLATGSTDGTIILWDLATRSRWATLTGQPGPVTALDWSPDSTTLATAGADSTITVWPVDPTTAVDRLCRTLAPDRHEPSCDH